VRLYLDNSVLNRPFDDQRQARIWLETLAFSLIMSLVESGDAEMICSRIHRLENELSPSLIRRRFVENCLRLAKIRPSLDEAVRSRASELQKQSFGPLDALHLASAEQADADYFLTCDDRLMRRYSGQLLVANPQTFINTLEAKP
jgi:predicted nucleic acid-binding protein